MMKEKVARLTPPHEAIERIKQGQIKQNKKQKTHLGLDKKCKSHVCMGTINSNMYDSDLTTTTSPLTSSTPYSG